MRTAIIKITILIALAAGIAFLYVMYKVGEAMHKYRTCGSRRM